MLAVERDRPICVKNRLFLSWQWVSRTSERGVRLLRSAFYVSGRGQGVSRLRRRLSAACLGRQRRAGVRQGRTLDMPPPTANAQRRKWDHRLRTTGPRTARPGIQRRNAEPQRRKGLAIADCGLVAARGTEAERDGKTTEGQNREQRCFQRIQKSNESREEGDCGTPPAPRSGPIQQLRPLAPRFSDLLCPPHSLPFLNSLGAFPSASHPPSASRDPRSRSLSHGYSFAR